MSDRRGYIVPIGGAEEKVAGRAILKRFVKICGRRDARIAIIPTASHVKETGSDYERIFKDLGVRRIDQLPFRKRSDCEREDWLEVLERATGVFLTGGHQLRLATTLGGTEVAETLRRRNAEGMHVAGTSAGASILSAHMIAFGEDGQTPRAGMVTLAPGLGLTPRLIIDQHFGQRDRIGRLIAALSYNPRLIGLGLDEDTAAFLGPDDEIEVVGSGGLTVVDSTDVTYTSMAAAEEKEPVSVIGLRVHVLVRQGTFNVATRVARSGVAIPVRR